MSSFSRSLSMKLSFRTKRYKVVETNENDDLHDSSFAKTGTEIERAPIRLRRGSKMTQSVRDAVGTLKQKFRTSARQSSRFLGRLPSRRSIRLAGKTPPRKSRSEVKMYSPFFIETPSKRGPGRTRFIDKEIVNLETPTRLKREVEALTANMQALATLSPNTLQSNVQVRRRKAPSPLTNGSLKMERSARRRIETTVY